MNQRTRDDHPSDWPDTQSHWESVYRDRPDDSVSWFQTRPSLSLRLIDALDLPRDAPIIDVGGGASRLVDCLLEQGYSDVTVLDVSRSALRASKQRAAAIALGTHWIEANALTFRPERSYRLWHDRALFHFFTRASQREAYRRVLRQALAPEGHAIIATFAVDGPERCSGLEVVRYDGDALLKELGPGFELRQEVAEDHLTPDGTLQRFTYFHLQRG